VTLVKNYIKYVRTSKFNLIKKPNFGQWSHE